MQRTYTRPTNTFLRIRNNLPVSGAVLVHPYMARRLRPSLLVEEGPHDVSLQGGERVRGPPLNTQNRGYTHAHPQIMGTHKSWTHTNHGHTRTSHGHTQIVDTHTHKFMDTHTNHGHTQVVDTHKSGAPTQIMGTHKPWTHTHKSWTHTNRGHTHKSWTHNFGHKHKRMKQKNGRAQITGRAKNKHGHTEIKRGRKRRKQNSHRTEKRNGRGKKPWTPRKPRTQKVRTTTRTQTNHNTHRLTRKKRYSRANMGGKTTYRPTRTTDTYTSHGHIQITNAHVAQVE